MKKLAGALMVAMGALLAANSASAENIKIGDITSYSAFPQATDPYRNGWELAVKEINAAGGVLGQQLEVISRDDAGKPSTAVRAAQELVVEEKVAMLVGGYLSNIAIAVSDFAKTHKTPFLIYEAQSDSLIWEGGNRYTFRLINSNYSQVTALAEIAAKLPAKRWATIAPNYAHGQSAVKGFKAALSERRPDVEFVTEQWPTLGKINAGPIVQAMLAARPDAIFNITSGPDLAKFAREGNLRGLFNDRPVISAMTGFPEYLDVLGAEAPEGWTVTGYPVEEINTPEFSKFREAYNAAYKDMPKLQSILGYTEMYAVKAIIEKAGSTDKEKLVDAAHGLHFDSPLGDLHFRTQDNQSTFGFYIGKLTLANNRGKMVDWKYVDGSEFQPSDEFVSKTRPADAQ